MWADILGRWAEPPTLRGLVRIPELPSSDADDFVCPNATEIASDKGQKVDAHPKNLGLKNGLWENSLGSISIPDG